MTSVRYRERIISPPRYRRQTVGMVYSLQNSQSVPNSARHSTPRPSSALDRKWVHRSQGDLTLDMDLQSHPRLQSEFYQELYQKYPHAFRRRLQARETGRKLFNSRLHVRFKDDADVSDKNSVSPGHLGNLHSNTHLTNWDREVGHYMKHKSRSRECVTSVEPSDCSGSVLSVTQRLKLNSQSLNKLLNDDLPLRKNCSRDYVQYDSGTENEQSLQDYMLEKSKERSRHRKQQRRIIIQRKIHKSESADTEVNKENETNSGRWMSKSVSPTRRLFKYSLPHTNSKHETHHVNVESLMADSDLKIDTLLEKISAKMSGPESPPDSAIDVDTPSVQSLVASDPKGVNSVKPDTDLPVLNGEQTCSFESPNEEMESSPGSSASAYVSKNSAKISSNDIMQNKVSSDTLQCCGENENKDSLNIEVHTAQNICKEEDEINRIVEKYASSENLNQNTGAGLLQLYTAEMGYDSFGSKETTVEASENVDSKCERKDKDDIDTKDDIEKNVSNEYTTSLEDDIPESVTAVCNEEEKDATKSEIDEECDNSTAEGDIRQGTYIIEGPTNPEFMENVDYHADDEHEADVVLPKVVQSNSAMSKRITTHRESDVDSGIGYSSTGTDTLPPRGRSLERETTKKHQPVRADHNFLPLRSEIDVDILDEVNLVHLSHDLLKSDDLRGRRGNSTREERDDTDIRLGVIKPSEKDRKIAEKYRRARSPSPYILCNRQSPAGFRPKSAPLFAQSEMDLRVVDISFSENSTGKTLEGQKAAVHEKSKSHTNSNDTSKTNSCQNTDIISKYSSLPNLTGSQSKHSKIQPSNNMSSRLVKQRKCSFSSISSKGSSISLLSENEADAMPHICNVSYDGAIEDFAVSPEGAIEEDYAKEIDEERFSEIELDSGTNIENLAENRPSELAKMIKGMYQPAVTSPRAKEKRLKIRNVLKNKKGSFNPPEDSKKPADEKNILNRIYAKSRVATGGYESVEKKSDDSASNSGTKSSTEVSKPDVNDKTSFDKNGIENTVGRRTPNESATSVDKDTESVDKFISGASCNTVTARPVILDNGSKEPESVKTDDPGVNGNENLTVTGSTINVQVEMAISPEKAQPPKKPVRNKNKNKNLNVLADQLNFSKYKIKVDDGQSAAVDTNLDTGKQTDLSGENKRSHDSPLQKNKDHGSTGPKIGQSQLGKGASVDSEIEVWQPLQSNPEVNENAAGKKRGSKGKFSFFKKALSMDRGIEKVGMDPNPTSQSSQGSKDNHSSFPKVKKAPSLKSFTSLFSRKKKKKGQFVIEDVENAGKKGSSLSRSEQKHALSNGKHQHWASCHSLETMESSNHHQPVRKQSRETVSLQQEIQPMGKLLKVNPDGTQIIQLVKPENGPIGFFIANGSGKYGNGIFVSRFVEKRPEQCFAGLLGVGDEILEVNGHLVRDLSQDAVYNLISASAVVLVKVFPFIARKDV
ncbi:uncharacterized protein LOC123551801 [Mercenaria mercenaria]|uniref:uncharacterized protein LOC123551801 n=1 Tax=Mercenaria mercenaria TaxID=6596 RepID=UPI00234E5376|nr:uncharacterized protein LOC123551801 [Mercenaria mercenaria]